MAFSKFKALFPTIIFVLICVLVSIIMLNFFQVDMNNNNGFTILNRALTVEGMKNDKKNNTKEGMCNSGKHKKNMCNGMNCEGMKNKEDEEEEEEEDMATTLASFTSNLMN